MAKTRVYELAQKLGLDNKVLLERLQDAGVEATSHMSALEEEDIRKFETGAKPVAEKVEEERITPGIIRRRRKEVPQVATEPAAPTVAEESSQLPEKQQVPEEVAPEKAPVVSEEKPEEKIQEKQVEEPKVPEPVEAGPKPQAPEEVAETKTPVSKEEKPAPPRPQAPEKSPQRATASRARILGRVELPPARLPRKEAAPPSRGTEPRRPATAEPAGARKKRTGVPSRPAQPEMVVPAAEPMPEKEGRKKQKKAKTGGDYGEAKREFGNGKRRRVEIFEPERGSRLRKGKKQAKPTKKTEITVSKAIKRIIRISDAITVGELAKRIGVKANDLIKELMRQGTMVTINHPLDFESAALIASEFNFEVENVAFDEESILEHSSLKTGEDEKPEDLEIRPPVVTIMGHVDHGKTSLLDAIRTANVTAEEAGGITQHIGAYDVEIEGRKITFVDTPGHEAFTAMRARGAKVTDIVILVVAADDGVMPQTKEAINHAKAAGVPILVAINKIDKADANPERAKQELTEFGLVPEGWGGDTIFVEVSAKNHQNLDQLLEMILLQAEVMELKASPRKRARGTIIEARLDRGRGPVATVLVQEGTLRTGDSVVSGVHFGRVRAMNSYLGQRVEEAGPSFPVEVTGLAGVPDAGDDFHAVEDDKIAKEIAQHRQQKLRETELAQSSKISLDQLYARIQEGDVKELKVIVKGDVQGSVEAVKDSLLKLSTDACRLVVIHTGVGGIIESDITLASASDAIVLGFNVRPESKASTLAEAEGVDIRLYNIIYDAVSDIRNAMEGLLAPTLREKELGRVEVRDTFHVSKVGTVAGCYVVEGKVLRGARVRLVRDNVVIWQGKMNSLKRFKDDAREVATGYECGIGLENYNDIKVGDFIEAFEIEEVKTIL